MATGAYETALLDQSIQGIRDDLAALGVDLNDPVAARAALATTTMLLELLDGRPPDRHRAIVHGAQYALAHHTPEGPDRG